jgi:hypothetical protein
MAASQREAAAERSGGVHTEFVQASTSAGGAYAAAEAAKASPLQTLEQDLLGATAATAVTPTHFWAVRPAVMAAPGA